MDDQTAQLNEEKQFGTHTVTVKKSRFHNILAESTFISSVRDSNIVRFSHLRTWEN